MRAVGFTIVLRVQNFGFRVRFPVKGCRCLGLRGISMLLAIEIGARKVTYAYLRKLDIAVAGVSSSNPINPKQ